MAEGIGCQELWSQRYWRHHVKISPCCCPVEWGHWPQRTYRSILRWPWCPLRALASLPPFRDKWLLSQVQSALKLYITVRMEEMRISGMLNMCKSGREHQWNKNKSSILCCLSWPESCSSEEKRWKRRLWSNKVFFLIKNAWCQSCHRNRGLCERAEHCTIKYCVL